MKASSDSVEAMYDNTKAMYDCTEAVYNYMKAMQAYVEAMYGYTESVHGVFRERQAATACLGGCQPFIYTSRPTDAGCRGRRWNCPRILGFRPGMVSITHRPCD